MRINVAGLGIVMTLVAGCSSTPLELDGAASDWPECPDGGVVNGGECVDPGGLSPCELIESRGGCPPGFHCVEGLGCVEGVECGDAICAPGELCIDDRCTCGDAPCPPGQVCAWVASGDDEPVQQCVDPSFDGDGDGHAVGDLDGDGLPDDCDDRDPGIGPASPETCDGRDNDCDGRTDEGFDADGDGFTTCGTDRYGPDCDDTDPLVSPGAMDLCQLGPDGASLNPDCDCCDVMADGTVQCDCCDRTGGDWVNPDCREARRVRHDWCPFGSQCCEGVGRCVWLTSDPGHCGSCDTSCGEDERCVVGRCTDSVAGFEPDPDEGEVALDGEPGPANHPDVAWNWMRVNSWFSWWERHSGDWFQYWHQYFFWELDYGIAWVQRIDDRGVLLFTGRHFVSSPIDPRGEVAPDVDSFLSPYRARTWYGTTFVDVLEGEDTIPCLAPAGGLGYGLVWSDGRGRAQIRFSAIGQYGSLPGWSQQVTRDDADHLYPRLAWSPYYYFLGSSYGLVYQREDDDEVQVYFQNIQGYWSWWAPFGVAYRVSDNPGGAINPDVAWSPYGFGVVWVGADDSNLWYALVSPWGGRRTSPRQLTDDGNVAAWRPAIAWNPVDGELGIAYQATSPPADNQDIYFIRTTVYGDPLGPPVRITSDREFQRHPDMAWADDGYGVTWYDRQSGNDEVAFAFLDPAGTVRDGPVMITDHGASGSGTNPAITYASVTDEIGGVSYGLFGWSGGSLLGQGEFALVWRDEETDGADPVVHFLRLSRSDE
jgi:hypothetical protein